jgi:hypothetical protein
MEVDIVSGVCNSLTILCVRGVANYRYKDNTILYTPGETVISTSTAPSSRAQLSPYPHHLVPSATFARPRVAHPRGRPVQQCS